MSIIVAKSSSGAGSGSVLPPDETVYHTFPAIYQKKTVSNTNTITIDSIPVSSFSAAKWLVVITTASGSLVRAYTVAATHRNGTNPSYIKYGMVGEVIDHTDIVDISGGELRFRVTSNYAAEDIVVHVTRVAIPLSSDVVNPYQVVSVSQNHSFVQAGDSGSIGFLPLTAIGARWVVAVSTVSGQSGISQVIAVGDEPDGCAHFGLVGTTNLPYQISAVNHASMGIQLLLTNLCGEHLKVDVTNFSVPTTPDIPHDGPTRFTGTSLWVPDAVTVEPDATTIVDQNITIPAHTGVKWTVTATDTVTFNRSMFEVLCTYNVALATTTMTYGKIGDLLDVVPYTSISGGNIHLTMHNNETNPVTINVLRTPVAL